MVLGKWVEGLTDRTTKKMAVGARAILLSEDLERGREGTDQGGGTEWGP